MNFWAYRMRPRWVAADRLPDDVRDIAEKELERATAAPGWNVKARRLRRDLHLLDVAGRHEGGLHSAKVGLVRDHPMLSRLPANAPRKVKAVFHGSVRFAIERADDYWSVAKIMNGAESAWAKFQEAA